MGRAAEQEDDRKLIATLLTCVTVVDDVARTSAIEQTARVIHHVERIDVASQDLDLPESAILQAAANLLEAATHAAVYSAGNDSLNLTDLAQREGSFAHDVQ